MPRFTPFQKLCIVTIIATILAAPVIGIMSLGVPIATMGTAFLWIVVRAWRAGRWSPSRGLVGRSMRPRHALVESSSGALDTSDAVVAHLGSVVIEERVRRLLRSRRLSVCRSIDQIDCYVVEHRTDHSVKIRRRTQDQYATTVEEARLERCAAVLRNDGFMVKTGLDGGGPFIWAAETSDEPAESAQS